MTPTPAGPPVVLLHLGTPKSGTTYLQNVLWRHKAALRKAGVLYPGRHYAAQFWAALDLQRIHFGGYKNPEVEGAWERLVERVREWPGISVISHEMFAPAGPEHVARALEDLDFAEVHLVLTARDLQRQIPAVWQEDLKNRHSVDYRTFLKALSDPAGGGLAEAETFWRMQNLTDIFARWTGTIPPERIHVVTVPPSGAPHDLLWHRFAGLLGIDGTDFDVSEIKSNPSLGAVEATLLRRVNQSIDRRPAPPQAPDEPAVSWPAYEKGIKVRLATRTLARRPLKLRFGLPPEEFEWVDRRAAGFIATFRRRGYGIVGDLDELRPSPPDPSRVLQHPDDVPDALVLDVAVETMADLSLQLVEQRESFVAELKETREALMAAYDRPILRQLAHKLGRWFPPLRRLLKAGMAVRERHRNRQKELSTEVLLPWDAEAAGAGEDYNDGMAGQIDPAGRP